MLHAPDPALIHNHTSFPTASFLHADNTTNALQVFLRPTPVAGHPSLPESEGTWIDANPVDGCFVVNVGEMVSRG